MAQAAAWGSRHQRRSPIYGPAEGIWVKRNVIPIDYLRCADLSVHQYSTSHIHGDATSHRHVVTTPNKGL